MRSVLCAAVVWFAPASASTARADDGAALAAARKMEDDRVRTVERVVPSVVAVFPDPKKAGGGSGVVIHPDGYALTNYHVVQVQRQVRGGLSDGKLYDADVLGLDPFGDIALFKMKGRRFEHSPLGNSDSLRLGDWTLAIGNPFLLAGDFRPTVTLGIVSGLHRWLAGSGMLDGNRNALTYPDCIQVDASINPGNSGGPLFNLEGRVVGINGRISLRDRGRMNIGVGFAVSINQVKEFLSDMRAGKECRHGTLEATVDTHPDGYVFFDAIQELGPADKAGIHLRDRLVEFDGRPVRTQNELLNFVQVLPAGRRVKLAWISDGKRREATVKLAAMPLGEKPLNWKIDQALIRTETRATLEGFRRFLGTDKKAPPAALTVTAELNFAAGIDPVEARPRVQRMAEELFVSYAALAGTEPEGRLRTVRIYGGDRFDGRHLDVVEVEGRIGRLLWHFDYLWAAQADRGRLDRVLSTDDPKAEWFLVPTEWSDGPVKLPTTWKLLRDDQPAGTLRVHAFEASAEARVIWK
jgi:S1-C subfamily serine protease